MVCSVLAKHHEHGIGFWSFHCRSRALCTSGATFYVSFYVPTVYYVSQMNYLI